MDTKHFDSPSELFFTDAIPADELATKQPEKNINMSKIIIPEEPKKRYTLTLPEALFDKARTKAKLEEGRSFNNYVNQLILRDLIK